MSTETANLWKVKPGKASAQKGRNMTVIHWDTSHNLTLSPETEDVAAVFENGRRIGWLQTRIKPGTETTKQFRPILPTLDESAHYVNGQPVRPCAWRATRAAAIQNLLFELKAPAEVARRRAERDAQAPDAARTALRNARTGLDAAEAARERAITARRAAVAQAIAAGMPRAEIAALLNISRQMVDRLAE